MGELGKDASTHGRGELLKLCVFALMVALFVAGLLLYLYLPWAGSRPAAVLWGATNTGARLWSHVLRRESSARGSLCLA